MDEDKNISDYDIQTILEEIQENVKKHYGQGRKATYIPALKEVDGKQFALTLIDKKGKVYSVGDDKVCFSIQSVSKILTLTMALNEVDQEVWGRMDREPTGKAFDSLIHLEEHNGIPSNPLLNSGAIVTADILLGIYGPKVIEKFLEFARTASGNPTLKIDEKIYKSEKRTAHRNYAFAHYIKSYGNIVNDVNEVLDVYFKFCSLSLNNIDLTKMFFYLANNGLNLEGERMTTSRHSKRINSIMFTCGTYDEVGDFAYLVGLPVKSGVSGAIAGCLPKQFSVSVWSPELNKKGNSYLGFRALELLTTMVDKSYLD
jgi:glutaminase